MKAGGIIASYAVPSGSQTNQTASQLSAELDKLKRARTNLERQWRINLSFYKGQQWVFFNPGTGQVENLPTLEGEKARFRVRITSNHILRATSSLLALLTKSKPVIYAIPSSTDASAIRSAELAENLVEYWWDQFKLADKMNEALLWGIIAGQGYWKINWNSNIGTPLEVVRDPGTGELITDPMKKQLLIDTAEQLGIPKDKVVQEVYTGDIDVQVLAPFQVYMDPNASVMREARYAYCQHGMSQQEVKDAFGVDLQPDSTPMNYEAVNQFMSTGKTDKSLIMVNYYYLPPNRKNPDGRYAIWTDAVPADDNGKSTDKKFLYDGKWPFPFNTLPIVKFPGIRIPGQIYDASVVEQAIPLQKNFNKTLSQVVEHTTLMVKPQILAPKGSLRKRLTNEPGAVVDYYPIAGQKPEAIPIPSIPTYVERHLDRIRADLDDLFMLPRVQQGSVPPNVEAAAAIDLLQETATDALSPIIKGLEESIADAGQFMLGLAREYYSDPRIVQITGNNGKGQIRYFRGAEIDAGVTVRAETGSGLPRTRAARQQRIMSLVQMGAIDIRKAWSYFDSADLKSLGAVFEANQTVARREYDMIVAGQPVNMVAARDAMKMIQMPGAQNPNTGQPFQSEDEIIDFLRQEALQPLVNEDLQTHMEEHAMQMNGIEFLSLQPQAQDDLTLHFNLTSQKFAANQKAQHDMENKNLNVNYQVKSTAGPTATSAILDKAGIQVSPQALTEPPLDTWVSDDVDKPNASDSANSQADEAMVEQTAIVDMAVKLHEMDLKQSAADHSQALDAAKLMIDQAHKEKQMEAQAAQANAQRNQSKT
jgi:hypothetical protein